MNDSVNSGMRNFWNDAGGRMWVNFQDIIEASMAPLGQEAMDVLTMVDGERVLDIGCGCGDTTFEIAQLIGPDGHVFGIDISEMIVAAAQKNIETTKQRNVSFECVDAQTYQFEMNAFDVIFSRFGVMFFDDPIAAFENIRKSLVPGGRMAFVCWQPVKAIEWISLPLEIVGNYVTLPEPSPPGTPGGFSFGDANRVNHILSSAGFVDIVVERFDTKINIGVDLDEALNFLKHIGPAGTVLNDPDIDSKTRENFCTDLRQRLEPYQTKQGVALGASTWIVTARNS